MHPWPGNGLYIHWIILGVLALFIAAGFLYRVSAAFFFLSVTYFFLLDQGRYVNHAYLICLISFPLIFVPAHRSFSIDARLFPKIRSQTTPAWSIWLLRAQMGAVYFFAGVAKISSDWLHGEPIRGGIRPSSSHFINYILHQKWLLYAASYGGLSFRPLYRAAALVATHPNPRVLSGPGFSPAERENVPYRHFSMAGDRSHHDLSFAGLAPPHRFGFS